MAISADDFNCGVVIRHYKGQGKIVEIPAEINGLPIAEIGTEAFNSCKTLTEIHVTDGVTKICDRAFSLCSRLTKIKISAALEKISLSAFFACSSLRTVQLPDSLTDIGEYAFGTCKALREIFIPDNVDDIGYNRASMWKILSPTCPKVAKFITRDNVAAIKNPADCSTGFFQLSNSTIFRSVSTAPTLPGKIT